MQKHCLDAMLGSSVSWMSSQAAVVLVAINLLMLIAGLLLSGVLAD